MRVAQVDPGRHHCFGDSPDHYPMLWHVATSTKVRRLLGYRSLGWREQAFVKFGGSYSVFCLYGGKFA